jgi:hypothetical protein
MNAAWDKHRNYKEALVRGHAVKEGTSTQLGEQPEHRHHGRFIRASRRDAATASPRFRAKRS